MRYGKIRIVGNSEFERQTKEALDLLKDKYKKGFDLAQGNLREICDDGGRPDYLDMDKKAYHVKKETAFSNGSEWYAGQIVHEAVHSYMTHEKGFPCTGSNREKHEKIAAQIQIDVLRAIKAPERLINYARKQVKERFWEKINVD